MKVNKDAKNFYDCWCTSHIDAQRAIITWPVSGSSCMYVNSDTAEKKP